MSTNFFTNRDGNTLLDKFKGVFESNIQFNILPQKSRQLLFF